MCSPFLGGASVELACAANRIHVHGGDAFAPLINFWNAARTDAELLADKVQKHFPLEKDQFYTLQKNFFAITSEVEQAATFFVLNRASYSGTTLSGGMSPKTHTRFTQSSIDKLKIFRSPNMTAAWQGFEETLNLWPDLFAYLDPPYPTDRNCLYGYKGDLHRNFDHRDLADILHARKGWVLSYKDDNLVRSLYGGYRFVELEWNYSMRGFGKQRELLIISE